MPLWHGQAIMNYLDKCIPCLIILGIEEDVCPEVSIEFQAIDAYWGIVIQVLAGTIIRWIGTAITKDLQWDGHTV